MKNFLLVLSAVVFVLSLGFFALSTSQRNSAMSYWTDSYWNGNFWLPPADSNISYFKAVKLYDGEVESFTAPNVGSPTWILRMKLKDSQGNPTIQNVSLPNKILSDAVFIKEYTDETKQGYRKKLLATDDFLGSLQNGNKMLIEVSKDYDGTEFISEVILSP